ncbi:MAG: tripartite tricarboxylate transporter substrate binding protein [Betaproteobacteria bacterium]|nr:MAG: tripartite tricarboxylate transporter substrate binding protein [Betaproteobacteria bacterium]
MNHAHAYTVLKLAAVATLGLTAIAPAAAQHYPTKAVRIIAPFPPGGSSDLVARILAQKLTEANGQQFVVDNRPGAGGTLGTDLAAKSAPDGYTLAVGNIAPLAVNVSLFKKLPYNPVHDFAPIAMSAVGTTVLVVHPSLPVRSVKELVALAKARPGQLNYGSGGSGTPAHLSGELFRHLAKVNIVHIPYKGTGLSLNELISGQIQLVFASMPVGLPHVKTGRLRALAVTSEKRSALAPELPTVAETVPGFQFDSWWGLTAPARTPNDIIMKLNGQLLQIVKQQDVKERFAGLGLEPVGTSPQQYAAFIKSEIDKVARIAKAIGLEPQ